jgi:hypothetical protein
MTLPFATPVSLTDRPDVIGVVVGVSSSTREGYAVAWPNGTRETRWRDELTLVPSPADVALSEIAALLGLPADAAPKTVVDTLRAIAAGSAYEGPFAVKIGAVGRRIGSAVK